MITIINKRHKEFSHQTRDDIKRAQKKHEKSIIQPRDREGNIDLSYLKEYGAKNLRVSEQDIRVMSKKKPDFARKLERVRQYQNEYSNNQKN